MEDSEQEWRRGGLSRDQGAGKDSGDGPSPPIPDQEGCPDILHRMDGRPSPDSGSRLGPGIVVGLVWRHAGTTGGHKGGRMVAKAAMTILKYKLTLLYLIVATTLILIFEIVEVMGR